jgi:CheY-like chemotaxis protein
MRIAWRAMTPRILMVDDNPGDLQLIEEAFKDSRIRVDFRPAGDAQAALGLLERALERGAPLPDVVLLDLNLPDMHGRDFIAALRARPGLAHLPVVVFSGEPSDAHALGAEESVQKPRSYAQYVALVQRLRRRWAAGARPALRSRRSAAIKAV